MSVKQSHIKNLKPDPKNANLHSEYGMGLLENSLRENGAGRSILLAQDNTIIAGNGVVESAAAVGIEKVRIIETDGNEIIAVKRTDIQPGSPEFFRMALADNVVAFKNIVLDANVVEAIAEEVPAVQFWVDAAFDIIDPKRLKEVKLPNGDKANFVQMTFTLLSYQGADVQKAIKIAKQVGKKRFSGDNQNVNGNALHFIIEEFLNKYSDVVIEEDQDKG